MSYEPPTPPAELPTDLVNTLNGSSSEQLQHVARYVEEQLSTKLARHVSKRTQMKAKSKNVPTICRTTSRRRPRSRSRRLTTTATTTGSGEKAKKFVPSIKAPSIPTSRGW